MENPERVIQESLSPIYIVSCGEGFNGEQLVQSVLVQFPDHHVPVIRIPHIRKQNQIRDVVEIAEKNLFRYRIRQFLGGAVRDVRPFQSSSSSSRRTLLL